MPIITSSSCKRTPAIPPDRNARITTAPWKAARVAAHSLPADNAKQIDRMIRFAAELKRPAVLYGGHEAYKIADEWRNPECRCWSL